MTGFVWEHSMFRKKWFCFSFFHSCKFNSSLNSNDRHENKCGGAGSESLNKI